MQSTYRPTLNDSIRTAINSQYLTVILSPIDLFQCITKSFSLKINSRNKYPLRSNETISSWTNWSNAIVWRSLFFTTVDQYWICIHLILFYFRDQDLKSFSRWEFLHRSHWRWFQILWESVIDQCFWAKIVHKFSLVTYKIIYPLLLHVLLSRSVLFKSFWMVWSQLTPRMRSISGFETGCL